MSKAGTGFRSGDPAITGIRKAFSIKSSLAAETGLRYLTRPGVVGMAGSLISIPVGLAATAATAAAPWIIGKSILKSPDALMKIAGAIRSASTGAQATARGVLGEDPEARRRMAEEWRQIRER